MLSPKIEIKNTSIVINDYYKDYGKSCDVLEKTFRVWDKLYYRYVEKGQRYIKEEHKLIIPRGYDIHKLELIFNTPASFESDIDPYDEGVYIRISSLYQPRDENQKKAISFVLGTDQYSYTKNCSQLAINLTTGSGKTYISIVCAALMEVRCIMITSSIDWINQWKDRILEYTDTAPNEIYIITGVASIAKILSKRVDVSKIKYFLASHMTLKKYGDKYGWRKLGELFKILRVGLKIYDEAHLYFDNMCDIDFATNTAKTLYLTATPARSDPSEDRIYQIAFGNMPALDLFDHNKDPRTNYTSIFYRSGATPQEIQSCMTRYGFSMTAYCNYIIHKPNFYHLLRILVEKILAKGKTLIYIGTLEAIDVVYRWIEYNYPELQGQIGIYTSNIPKEAKPEQLNKLIILSTIKSCGAAMDIDGLAMTIVLAEPFKSSVLAIQTLGRTRGIGTDYAEIVDSDFAVLYHYYKAKQNTFAKYALSNSRIDLRSSKLLFAYARKSIYDQQQRLMAMKPSNQLINVFSIKE